MEQSAVFKLLDPSIRLRRSKLHSTLVFYVHFVLQMLRFSAKACMKNFTRVLLSATFDRDLLCKVIDCLSSCC